VKGKNRGGAKGFLIHEFSRIQRIDTNQFVRIRLIPRKFVDK